MYNKGKNEEHLDPTICGFSAFRVGFPQYSSKSVFLSKVEVVTDGKGVVVGVTNKDKLLYIDLPASDGEIQNLVLGKGAFLGCSHLRRARFASNLEALEEEAFKGCSLLEDLELGSGVYELGEGAFEGTALKSFCIPREVTELPARLFNECRSLHSVVLHQGITKIGAMCFSSCSSLSSIDLGFTLTEIPDGAFMGSGLQSISIPHSVKRIGASAFSRCAALKYIYYDGKAEDFRRISFGIYWNKGIPETCRLYVKDDEGLWVDAFAEDRSKKKTHKTSKVQESLELLGLKDIPTLAELNSAYRQKARKFHPDVISGLDLDQEFLDFASEKFRKLTEAYEYLKKYVG